MNCRRIGIVGILVVVASIAFAGGVWAQGQTTSVKIGFSFMAQGKSLPAGKYNLEVTSAGRVVLHAEKGGAATELKPIKALGQDGNGEETKLVFDKIGSIHFLSEVWLPGQDGYLVGTSTGTHEQEVVKAKK